MSATGVGIRVMLGGQRVDDGCLAGSAVGGWGEPYTDQRTNLMTNPSFELDLNGWAGSGATAARNAGWAAVGGYSALVTAAGSATAGDLRTNGGGLTSFPLGMRPGKTYSMRVVCNTPAAHKNFVANAQSRQRRILLFQNIGTGTFTEFFGPQALNVAGTFTLQYTFTVPANCLGLILSVGCAGGTGETAFITYVDAVQLEEVPAPLGTYFDGDTAPAAGAEFKTRWTGTRGNSTSVLARGTYTAPYLEGMTAAEGLTVTWGRKTAIEQPTASTCTLRVWDDPGGATYTQTLAIGTPVEVWAEGTVASGGNASPTFADPGFESGVRAVTSNAEVGRTTRPERVKTGTYAAQLGPQTMAGPWSAQFPPAELQAPGGNPGAWDTLQRLNPGETWRIQLELWVPEQVRVAVRPLIYTGPYATTALAQPVLTNAVGPGWVTIDAPYVPGAVSGWLGVQLDVAGGLTWAEVPASLTWATEPPTVLWEDYSDTFIDSINILAPPAGSKISILVFGGRITDLQASYDSQVEGAGVDITAVDFLGDLGNRYVGDEPWLAETLQTRFLRVLQLASVAGEKVTTADIAPTLGPIQMTWEDVDHKAASGLLVDMANSVDGVLWSATHQVTGPYVKLEDPARRASLYRLQLQGGLIVVLPIDPTTLPPEQRPTELSACDVLRDPVQFVRDVTDVATRVTVAWQQQTTDPDTGNPTTVERTSSTVLTSREIDFGSRAISMTSMLTSQTEADRVADRLIARQSGQWRIDGLAVGDADFQVPDAAAGAILLALLDGVRRGGLPLLITDMPAWSPLGEVVPVYLEGGVYTFVDGGWQLDLSVSRASGLGANAQWDQLTPTWTWDMWQPTLTWDDLRGVAGPVSTKD